LSIIPS
jgi:chromosome segregation ATPase